MRLIRKFRPSNEQSKNSDKENESSGFVRLGTIAELVQGGVEGLHDDGHQGYYNGG
jgi:hypothetical protein